MRGIEGEQVLLRLILSESRQHDHRPLFRAILELLRAEGMAGTTVIKGIAGFGHDGSVHTTAIEAVSADLPLVIEVVDTQERIDRVVPRLAPLLEGGVMMLERARVIRYARSSSGIA
jgi:PII-like signaling protein